ncbi:hypothetical protein [Acetatifactor muris]|uniref:hypothetical protein n=1 Tax=Acetatifactor muris TaxID=879566 RepID=UPI0023F3922C|nr:hypothetical protein [Acetatifactor muris]
MWEGKSEQANYILRYYLPCAPLFDEETIRNRMEGLPEFCVRYQIPAVMLYVDLNPCWYYLPDTPEHTAYYVEVVRQLAVRLREKGISYQLNYQNLFGATDGAADLRNVYRWEMYVDEKGMESGGVACMAGEKFRETAGKKLRMWAATRPDVIWIDDDMRFHNHGTAVKARWQGKHSGRKTDYGCFCPRHMAMYNARMHTSYTREELVTEILEGSARADWMAFTGECMTETARWVEHIIHEVSPETGIAIMTSTPDVHSVEGRHWGDFLESLSGKDMPLLRPYFGPYSESAPKDFFTSYLMFEQLKVNVAGQYRKEFAFYPEIENTRFTRWSKSLAATGYQIMLAAFLGSAGITLSLYDLEGCVLAEEPEYGELLMKLAPFVRTMRSWGLWEWQSDGIALVTAPERAGSPWNMKKVREMDELAQGRMWDTVLVRCGIACRYVTPEHLEETACVALDACTAALLKDEEIRLVLTKGVLLDAGAAGILIRRGFGACLGAEVGESVECVSASELLCTMRHQDNSPVRVPSRIDGGKWSHLLLKGAEELSRLMTPGGREYPGFTEFRNSLGGRVVIYAGNGAVGDGFYTNYRVRLLKGICGRLSGGSSVTVDNGSYMLLCVKKRKNEMALFAANLTADRVDEMMICVPGKVKSASLTDGNGTGGELEVAGNEIHCRGLNLGLYEGAVIRLQR